KPTVSSCHVSPPASKSNATPSTTAKPECLLPTTPTTSRSMATTSKTADLKSSVNSKTVAEFENLEQLHDLCRLRSTLEAFAADRLRSHPSRGKILNALAGHLVTMKRHASLGEY